MPGRRGDILSKLAGMQANPTDRSAMPNKLSIQMEEQPSALEELAAGAEASDIDAGRTEPEIDLDSMSPEMRTLYEQVQSDRESIEKERKEFQKEQRKLRSSYHQQGALDGDLAAKAAAYDALTKNPEALKSDPRFASHFEKGELSEELRAHLDAMPPGAADAIEHLSLQALQKNPQVKALMDSVKTLEDRQQTDERVRNERELVKVKDLMEKRGMDPEVDLTHDQVNQVIAMRQNPVFAQKSMVQLFEMVLGQKLQGSSRPQADGSTAPPVARSTATPRQMSRSSRRKTKDIHEAGARVFEQMKREGHQI